MDKFFHPLYWINGWIPLWTIAVAAKLGVGATQFVYLNGVFEILIGLSLLSGVFLRLFTALGIVFLIGIFVFIGVSEITVRDFGLMGGLLALFLWPERRD